MNKLISNFFSIVFGGKGKIKHIRQAVPGQHGITSIAMLLNYYDIKIKTKNISQKFPQYDEGISLRGVADVLDEYGLPSQIFQCKLDALKNVEGPFIFLWKMQQFAVLDSKDDQGYWINDPAYPKRILVEPDEFECCFSEVIIVPIR